MPIITGSYKFSRIDGGKSLGRQKCVDHRQPEAVAKKVLNMKLKLDYSLSFEHFFETICMWKQRFKMQKHNSLIQVGKNKDILNLNWPHLDFIYRYCYSRYEMIIYQERIARDNCVIKFQWLILFCAKIYYEKNHFTSIKLSVL